MKKSLWIWILGLVMIMTACTKQTTKELFDFDASAITKITVDQSQGTLDVNQAYPLNRIIMKPAEWKEIEIPNLLKDSDLDLMNESGQTYQIFRQSDKAIILINDDSDETLYAFEITLTLFDEILSYIDTHYLVFTPGNFAMVKFMRGNEDNTTFEIDPLPLKDFINPDAFITTSPVNLDTQICLFTLIDFKGNLYRFYPELGMVKVEMADGIQSSYYQFSMTEMLRIKSHIKSVYADQWVVNALKEVRFTSVYLESLGTFSESKMISISLKSSDQINDFLDLTGAYLTKILPLVGEKQQFILKDDQGLYYVIWPASMMVGVGTDPKGELTTYIADIDARYDFINYMVHYPLLPPTGTILGSGTITKIETMFFGGEQSSEFSLTKAQSEHLTQILDLSHKTTVTMDTDSMKSLGYYLSVFTDSGRNLIFRFDEAKKTTVITVDYNGALNGKSYYLYDDPDGLAFQEAVYYLAGLYQPVKADQGLTYTGAFVGNILDYPDTTAIPYQTLTSVQLTKIKLLLQSSSWQAVDVLNEAKIESGFVLKISDTSHIDFSMIGSMAVASLNTGDSSYWGKYLIPMSAYQDTLAYLKSQGN